MTEKEALEFIYSRIKFNKINSFDRIRFILEKLGSPEKKLKFVHVVGTNGKGSVSSMLSCVLIKAGYKTGLFTSPFVTVFRERIQIDGKYVQEEAFCRAVSKVQKACKEAEKNGLFPTFFEVVLASALVCFEEAGCQAVILEAGIGGKDDSTNIIPAPLAAVITSVSLDHTDVLGSTAQEIAKAKCGVIKSTSAVVSFPKNRATLDFLPQRSEVAAVIENTCREKGCELVFPDMESVTPKEQGVFGNRFLYKDYEITISLSGAHQIANACTAVEAAQILMKKGFPISKKNIEDGLACAFMPARMELIAENPPVILDGGHNEGCANALYKMLSQCYGERKCVGVLSFMKDKDYEAAIRILSPLFDSMIFTLAEEKRGESPHKLSSAAKGRCKNLYVQPDVQKAYRKAQTISDGKLPIVCAGSFYLVSQIRKNFFPDDIRQK